MDRIWSLELRDGLYTADQINLNQLGINERQNRLGVEDYTAGIFLCMSIASAYDMRRHEYSFMKLSCSLSKNTYGINRHKNPLVHRQNLQGNVYDRRGIKYPEKGLKRSLDCIVHDVVAIKHGEEITYKSHSACITKLMYKTQILCKLML